MSLDDLGLGCTLEKGGHAVHFFHPRCFDLDQIACQSPGLQGFVQASIAIAAFSTLAA
jgi:hypothetical protein